MLYWDGDGTVILAPAEDFLRNLRRGDTVGRTTLLVAAALLALGSRAARAQAMDQHYISPDSEYFVADQDYNGGWQWVVLAA